MARLLRAPRDPRVPPGGGAAPLRLLAVFKLAKAVALVAVALAAFGLLGAHARTTALAVAARALARFGEGTEFLALHAVLGPRVARLLAAAADWLGTATPTRLMLTGTVAAGYALLLGAEGVGLWLARPWAERLSVVATASLIPFELYELARRVTPVRGAVLVLNVAAVWYLVRRIRREHQPSILPAAGSE